MYFAIYPGWETDPKANDWREEFLFVWKKSSNLWLCGRPRLMLQVGHPFVMRIKNCITLKMSSVAEFMLHWSGTSTWREVFLLILEAVSSLLDDHSFNKHLQAHGTYIGNFRLEKNKPTQLPVDSVFRFGESTRRFFPALSRRCSYWRNFQQVCDERKASNETQTCYGWTGEDRLERPKCNSEKNLPVWLITLQFACSEWF